MELGDGGDAGMWGSGGTLELWGGGHEGRWGSVAVVLSGQLAGFQNPGKHHAPSVPPPPSLHVSLCGWRTRADATVVVTHAHTTWHTGHTIAEGHAALCDPLCVIVRSNQMFASGCTSIAPTLKAASVAVPRCLCYSGPRPPPACVKGSYATVAMD